MIAEGAISVKACISCHKREVKTVCIDRQKKHKDFNYIRKICRENCIEVKEINREDFAQYTESRGHGGIIAEVGERRNDELPEGDVFYLDGIEDPFNLGYIIRTLYAFGIKNILLPERDLRSMESQLLKSSAGAYEMANVRMAPDPLKDISELKEKGYVACALKRGDDAEDIFDHVFADRCVFLLGGEKRGISATLLDICDRYLYISYGSDFRNSLNAAAAADVVATLLYRQKK